MILPNGRLTIEEISLKFGANVGTFYKIIQDDLNFQKNYDGFPKCRCQRMKTILTEFAQNLKIV